MLNSFCLNGCTVGFYPQKKQPYDMINSLGKALTKESIFMISFVCSFANRNGVNGCEGKEKWYKFNDTIVEEFDMNEDTLEAECFGGTYKATVYDTGEYEKT